MTHPEEQLAGYLDGTLGTDERAVVDAHLETCATCREEVELARTAVDALSAIEEVPVPFGVTGPVLREAGLRFERRRSAIWSRVQWATGAAAAAALVLVVAVNLDLGDRGEPADRAAMEATGVAGADAGAPEGAAALAAAPPRLEQQDANYGEEGVESLAVEAARAQRALGAAPAPSAEAAAEDAVTEDAFRFSAPGPALDCLRRAEAPVGDVRDTLVRLIEARFADRPAYLAVFLESPGAGQPPDRVVVWVVSKDGCQILTGAQQTI